jgi:uncharacterized membrane protein YfcA
LASFVTSAFGFGFGLVAMPCLLFIFDVQTATPLVAGTGTITAFIVTIRLWRHVKLKSMYRLLCSGLVGIPFGLMILKWVQNDVLVTVLGAVIIVSSLFQLYSAKAYTLRTDKFSFVFGFLAGLLGVSYNIPAPPLVIYSALRRWDKETFKGTLQGLFIILGILINIGHISVGFWTLPLLKLLGICVPFVAIGIITGFQISRSINQKDFDRYIHLILIFLGGLIIVKSVV